MAYILISGPPSSSKTETMNNLSYLYGLIFPQTPDMTKGDTVVCSGLEGVREKYNDEIGTMLSDPGVAGGSGETRVMIELHNVADKVLNLKIENVNPLNVQSEVDDSSTSDLKTYIKSLSWPPSLSLQTLSEHSLPGVSNHYPSSSPLKSSIASLLSPSTFLLVDYGAPVKGWRYEVHCLARQSGCRFGVVFTGEKEGGEGGRGVLGEFENTWGEREGEVEGIRYSFEIPNPFRDRWDRPLYKILRNNSTTTTTTPQVEEVSAFDQEGMNDLVNPNSNLASAEEVKVETTENQGGFKKKVKKKKKKEIVVGLMNDGGFGASDASGDDSTTLKSFTTEAVVVAQHYVTPSGTASTEKFTSQGAQHMARINAARKIEESTPTLPLSTSPLKHLVNILHHILTSQPLIGNMATKQNVQLSETALYEVDVITRKVVEERGKGEEGFRNAFLRVFREKGGKVEDVGDQFKEFLIAQER